MFLGVLRILFIILMVIFGRNVGVEFDRAGLGMVIGAVLGFVLVFVEVVMKEASLRGLTSAIFGAILGLITAKIAHDVMVGIGVEKTVVELVTPVFTFVLIYIGVVFSLKKRDEFALVIPYIKFTRTDRDDRPILLDTSAVLDGRVFDVVRTGFLSGLLIVPAFVVEEMQTLADSADPNKRQKGRLGLELLNTVKKDKNLVLEIYEEDLPEDRGVDAKLVHLAKILGARVVTMDYNLAKVAEIEGIKVLNLNELISALQPKVYPGQSFQVRLVRDGKEANQAVGYTPEGTMVVVENARSMIGKTVWVEVYNTIQTPSGKIIFTRLKGRNGNRERKEGRNQP